MYLCDQHTHSKYSFDGKSSIDRMCEAAIEKGLNELVITDHYDTNFTTDNFFAPYDDESAYNDILSAKEKYRDRIKVSYGIEIGQMSECPEIAMDMLKKHDFDFVLGSLHNLRGMLDFYFIDYCKLNKEQCAILWEKYLKELYEMIEFGRFHSLAHLPYPIRYFKRQGIELDIRKYLTEISEILKKLIEKSIALEINTSGLRQGTAETLPNYEIVQLYRSMGGELITVGSDAHTADDIGADIAKVYKDLGEIGFKYITVFHDGKPQMLSII